MEMSRPKDDNLLEAQADLNEADIDRFNIELKLWLQSVCSIFEKQQTLCTYTADITSLLDRNTGSWKLWVQFLNWLLVGTVTNLIENDNCEFRWTMCIYMYIHVVQCISGVGGGGVAVIIL